MTIRCSISSAYVPEEAGSIITVNCKIAGFRAWINANITFCPSCLPAHPEERGLYEAKGVDMQSQPQHCQPRLQPLLHLFVALLENRGFADVRAYR